MAGVATDESELGRSFEGFSSGQQQQLCQSGEALAEWRSSEQVENGSPSTSLLYWDSDEDDGGLKPSDLYGKYTWKIDKFSQINKRELRSNAFEVGGYKWYILIYPQGCDVCNHLSLFLCVANHDKLLPGWNHFAQFTIAVVNKDPKKSKYSDTLHRFWKKEHDWGWKKFMELSKVLDGFLDDDDTLIIKAQVQVIREKTNRPFRCLDHQYRRELVRVYLTNVEQICRRFVEERRGKLVKLIDDKARWSSFCSFWLGMDQSSRRRMSQEKTELILRVIVRHFFIEKEVTSTLVMDALYSGLKALNGQNKGKKNKGKLLEAEELPMPIVSIEKDIFVLVDDVLLLLGRAAMEPLPPKDDKGPQNRTKDGTGEEFNKDLLERDERRLTELGRRTIEIFVLAHIFSKIEVAYQEAVALKKQEELIREEEAAWLAELEQKARRRAPDKEKKSKKKQGKQKRNNRKGKDKGKDDKVGISVKDKIEHDKAIDERRDSSVEPVIASEKCITIDAVEDVSDVSDSMDCVPETLGTESEDRAASPVIGESDTMLGLRAEVSSSGVNCILRLQNGIEGRNSSPVDDSSSTCSSESVPSVVIRKDNSHQSKNKKSPCSGQNQQHKLTSDRVDWVTDGSLTDGHCLPSESVAVRSPSQIAHSSQDQVLNGTEQHVGKREEETDSLRKTPSSKVTCRTSPPASPSKSVPSHSPPKPKSEVNTPSDAGITKEQPSDNPKVSKPVHRPNSAGSTTLKPDAPIFMSTKSAGHPMHVGKEKLQAQDTTVLAAVKPLTPPLIPRVSRPLSAPLVPGPNPVSVACMVQTAPALTRSVSAAGRLGPEVPAASGSPSFIPQSYRNAMMGVSVSGTAPTYSQNHPGNSVVNPMHLYSPEHPRVSTQLFSPRSSDRMDSNPPIKPTLSFRMASHHNNMSRNGSLWIEQPQRDSILNLLSDCGSLTDNRSMSCSSMPSEFPSCTSAEEFPHLDIINDLLDDEHGIGIAARVNSRHQHFSNSPHSLNRHYSFPGDPAASSGLGTSQSSCRFDRTHSYHNNLHQQGYGIPGRAYDTFGDVVPQSISRPYGNGLRDGYQPSQWQMPGSDIAFWGIRHMDGGGGDLSYNIPEYQNVNGYTVFRQPNGI